jgi:hypothetical protein
MRESEIDAAIAAEERELLRQIGEEPGYIAQASSIFRGNMGWVNVVLLVVQSVLFAAGAYAAWQFFAADNVLTALRWGLPAATLLLMALIVKTALMPVIQVNRVLRAVARLGLASSTQVDPN